MNNRLNRFSKSLIAFSLILMSWLVASAQQNNPWDDNSIALWPKEAEIIEIKSSMDDNSQKSYLFRSKSNEKRPLIISLHTWGGNYQQKDPLLQQCIAADVNYIHPDFRGPNITPQAAGSRFVIQDIDDAIQWAIDSLQVQKNQIHVIGVSGGAMASVLTYMKSKHQLTSVHAFVGIYNLEDWFHESKARNKSYAEDILKVTGSTNNILNIQEARSRSPYFMETPIKKRAGTTLILYGGLHDGYTGSVPITQTLEMYNKILNDFDSNELKSQIPIADIYTLLKRRYSPNFQVIKGNFMGRDLIYKKNYQEKIEVLVFDGGHEMPAGNFLQFVLK
ncbi:MAG: alpha/beta hydrolase family protein [Sphingobacterium sp.]